MTSIRSNRNLGYNFKNPVPGPTTMPTTKKKLNVAPLKKRKKK